MAIIKFLVANWDSALVVAAFIVFLVVLIKRGETKILKTILFNLVTKAEQQLGSGTGALKFSTVVDWLYERIPAVLKLLFTKKDIENLIESALAEAKKQWATNDNVKMILLGETPTPPIAAPNE